MLRLFAFTRLLVIAASSLMLLAGASVALATSTTGSQNPDLTVSASLASSGANPDQATTGDTVTAAAAETNNTATKQSVRVSYTLTYPDGRVVTSAKQLILAPGQTQTQSLAYTVDAADPKGTYTYTVSASDKRGTSRATATIQVT